MIELEEAGFSYGRTAVLRDMTLTLAPGSFHFLIGPSGSGKTTLLRLCYMDLVPTEGRDPLLRPRHRRRVIAMRLPACAARSGSCTRTAASSTT